jgi:hypothetical protein
VRSRDNRTSTGALLQKPSLRRVLSGVGRQASFNRERDIPATGLTQGDAGTAHPVVQQHKRVGASRQPVCGRAVTGQFDQVTPRFSVKEASEDHQSSKIASTPIGKGFSDFRGVGVYHFTAAFEDKAARDDTLPHH